jgi:hypothetical protein
MKNQKLVFPITLGFAIVCVSLFFVSLINGWFGPWVGTGAEFCEASRPGLIKQPANTWSNIGFIIAGLTIGWQLSKGTFSANKNTITQKFFYGTFLACIVVFLGPGSMAMHASEASLGGWFDMLSMYLICSYTFAYAIEKFFSLSVLWFLIIFTLSLGTCLYVQELPYHIPVVGFIGNFIFAVFISLTIIFELLNTFIRKLTHEKKYGFLSVSSLLLAFGIWNLWKNDSYLCDPQSLIQGHAMWHLLDALAAYFLFRFYASEHKETLA